MQHARNGRYGLLPEGSPDAKQNACSRCRAFVLRNELLAIGDDGAILSDSLVAAGRGCSASGGDSTARELTGIRVELQPVAWSSS